MFTAEETVKSILLIWSKIPHQKGLYLYNMQHSFVLRPLIEAGQDTETQQLTNPTRPSCHGEALAPPGRSGYAHCGKIKRRLLFSVHISIYRSRFGATGVVTDGSGKQRSIPRVSRALQGHPPDSGAVLIPTTPEAASILRVASGAVA